MTSKTLSNKLFRQESLRRIWAYIIIAFITIVTGPGSFLILLDSIMSSTYSSKKDLIDYIDMYFKTGYPGRNIFPIVMGLVLGYICFSYVYSKSKVDLFHSMPIKRQKLFVCEYLTSFIPGVIILIMQCILTILACVIKGVMGYVDVAALLGSTLLGLLVFFLAMNITVIAVMITGNKIVGVLGAIVLLVFPESVHSLIEQYKGFCYQTYMPGYSARGLIETILNPICIANTDIAGKGVNIAYLCVVIIEAVVLFAVAMKLYIIRPSEKIGRALCYSFSEAIVRIPLVIFASLFGGIYLQYIFSNFSAGWYFVIFAMCGIVTHMVLEAIFNQSFKSVIRHPIQGIISLAVALFIALFFIYDLGEYDTYLPDKNKVASVSIGLNSIENDMSLYEVHTDADGELSYEYIDSLEKKLANRNIKNTSNIYEMAKSGIDALKGERSAIARNRDVQMQANGYDEEKNMYSICYHMKSGKDIYRTYTAPVDATYEAMSGIYSEPAYKEVCYSIDDYIEKKAVHKISIRDDFDEEAVITGEDVEEFLLAYSNDLSERTLDDLRDNYPIAFLSNYDQKTYTDLLSGYYIYSFDSNTLDYLKSKGVEIKSPQMKVDAADVEEVYVRDYRYDVINPIAKEVKYVSGSDDEIIAKICDIGVADHFTYINSVLHKFEQGVEGEVSLRNGNKEPIYTMIRFHLGELPEKIRTDLDNSVVNDM